MDPTSYWTVQDYVDFYSPVFVIHLLPNSIDIDLFIRKGDWIKSQKIWRGTTVHSFYSTAIEIKKIGTGEKSDRNTKSAPASSLVSGVVFTRS